MSWLVPDADWHQLVDLHPVASRRLSQIEERLWSSGTPPRVLELCRLRVAHLFGATAEAAWHTPGSGLEQDEIDQLTRWPTSRSLTSGERASLAVSEQVAIDVHGVTDEQVEAVRTELGDAAAVGLFVALALVEGSVRGQLALGAGRGRPWPGPSSGSSPGSERPPSPRPGSVVGGAENPADGLRVSSRIPVDRLGDDAGFRSGVLELQPTLCDAFLRYYGTLWSEGELDHPAKEIARIRNARLLDCGW